MHVGTHEMQFLSMVVQGIDDVVISFHISHLCEFLFEGISLIGITVNLQKGDNSCGTVGIAGNLVKNRYSKHRNSPFQFKKCVFFVCELKEVCLYNCAKKNKQKSIFILWHNNASKSRKLHPPISSQSLKKEKIPPPKKLNQHHTFVKTTKMSQKKIFLQERKQKSGEPRKTQLTATLILYPPPNLLTCMR